jgi:hypothetical protein
MVTASYVYVSQRSGRPRSDGCRYAKAAAVCFPAKGTSDGIKQSAESRRRRRRHFSRRLPWARSGIPGPTATWTWSLHGGTLSWPLVGFTSRRGRGWLSGARKDLFDNLEFPIEFSPGEEFALLDLVEGAVGGSDEGTLQDKGIIDFLGGLWTDTFTQEAAIGTLWDMDMDLTVYSRLHLEFICLFCLCCIYSRAFIKAVNLFIYYLRKVVGSQTLDYYKIEVFPFEINS